MFTTVLLPLALAFIMVSLGFSLRPADFRRVLTAPRAVAIGLANLLVLSPLLALGSAELFGLGATLAVGLVLLGASPGGTMANLLTHLARGNVALSVTMTAVSSVAAVITVPLFLTLAIDHFGADLGTDVKMGGVVARVFLITIIPLSIGMYVRDRRPEWVERNEQRFKRGALAVFVLIVIGAVASEWETVTENFAEVAAAALALNVAAMTASYSIARAARLDGPSATAISMELGVHNSTLAITVATSVSAELAIPAAVYSAFMFITAGLFARAMHGRNSRVTPRVDPAAA